MFQESFMDFGGDFNRGRVSDHRLLPDFSSGGFLRSLDTNPFPENTNTGLDLCMKLNEMGISCDMSIWSGPEPFRVDPRDFGSRYLNEFTGFEQNLGGVSRILDGFHNVSSVRQAFLQNSSHGVSPLLGFQDSLNPNGLREMVALNNGRDFLFDHINGPIKPYLRNVSLGNEALMFEGNKVSHALAAMEVSGASYPHDSFRGVSLGNDALMFEGKRISRALAAMEVSGASYPEDSLRDVSPRNDAFNGSLMFEGNRVSRTAMEVSGASLMSPFNQMRTHFKEDELKRSSDLPLNLASTVNIYGSVKLMAKDQIGCRVLQKLVDEGTILDFKVIFREIIANVTELSIDPFGNYLVQKLLDVCDEEQRTLIVSVLTSRPMELIKVCLNTYGTRVVQNMIETVKTKQQISMVKSGLKPGFLTLVKDLNGNHVIQSCLDSFGPNDNKFLLEAAIKYCAEIATHRRGCCVLQCCIANSVGPQRERLVNEISRNSLHLSQDPFGNYVVQYLMEQKVPSEKLLIQFRMNYAKLATQKFSSHVIEKCLRVYPESRAEIVRELLSVPNFEYLLQDPFANYVIQTALSVTKDLLVRAWWRKFKGLGN